MRQHRRETELGGELKAITRSAVHGPGVGLHDWSRAAVATHRRQRHAHSLTQSALLFPGLAGGSIGGASLLPGPQPARRARLVASPHSLFASEVRVRRQRCRQQNRSLSSSMSASAVASSSSFGGSGGGGSRRPSTSPAGCGGKPAWQREMEQLARREARWLRRRQGRDSPAAPPAELAGHLSASGLEPGFQELVERPVRQRAQLEQAERALDAAAGELRQAGFDPAAAAGEEAEVSLNRVRRAAEQFDRVTTADPFNMRAKMGGKRAAALQLEAEKRHNRIRKVELLKKRYGADWEAKMVMEAEQSEAEMKKVFALIDADGCGTLDRSEIRELLHYFNLPSSPQDLDTAMAKVPNPRSLLLQGGRSRLPVLRPTAPTNSLLLHAIKQPLALSNPCRPGCRWMTT